MKCTFKNLFENLSGILFGIVLVVLSREVHADESGQLEMDKLWTVGAVPGPVAGVNDRGDPADMGLFFSTQNEGLAAVVRELDALAELVEIVSRLPMERGEFVIAFPLIQADLAALRAGLVEAIRKPTTAARVYPPLSTEYLQ